MKVNLKTFPTPPHYQDYLSLSDWLYDVMKWRDNFEAELLAEIKHIESYKKGNFRILWDENYKVWKKLKEILGE